MVRSSHEGGGAMNNIKTKKSKIRGLWYMHLMLLVFWPLSILEYIRISKENKRIGAEWDWRVQIMYWIVAPCVILIMTAIWIFAFLFFKFM